MADTHLEQMRYTILQQADELTGKPRFGLFSHPVSTAVGDNGAYLHPLPKRGTDNKPATGPKNVFTSPTKTSKTPGDFFGPLNSLTTSEVKDVYVDSARRSLMMENQSHLKNKSHEVAFFPSSGDKTLATASYPFESQKPQSLDPKRKRNQEGSVVTGPQNMKTNPMTTVQRAYFKQIPYMSEPYSRGHDLHQEWAKKEKAKEPEAAFHICTSARGTFNKDITVYGSDTPAREVTHRPSSLNIYKHEVPFKSSSPNKKGLYGFLGDFPKHMANPEKQSVRHVENPNKKQGFKGMSVAQSRPSPSIMFTPSIIRRHVGHSLSRH